LIQLLVNNTVWHWHMDDVFTLLLFVRLPCALSLYNDDVLLLLDVYSKYVNVYIYNAI
jgi:hypothetical protein